MVRAQRGMSRQVRNTKIRGVSELRIQDSETGARLLFERRDGVLVLYDIFVKSGSASNDRSLERVARFQKRVDAEGLLSTTRPLYVGVMIEGAVFEFGEVALRKAAIAADEPAQPMATDVIRQPRKKNLQRVTTESRPSEGSDGQSAAMHRRAQLPAVAQKAVEGIQRRRERLNVLIAAADEEIAKNATLADRYEFDREVLKQAAANPRKTASKIVSPVHLSMLIKTQLPTFPALLGSALVLHIGAPPVVEVIAIVVGVTSTVLRFRATTRVAAWASGERKRVESQLREAVNQDRGIARGISRQAQDARDQAMSAFKDAVLTGGGKILATQVQSFGQAFPGGLHLGLKGEPSARFQVCLAAVTAAEYHAKWGVAHDGLLLGETPSAQGEQAREFAIAHRLVTAAQENLGIEPGTGMSAWHGGSSAFGRESTEFR